MNNQAKIEIAKELLKYLVVEGLELKAYEKDLDTDQQLRSAFMRFFGTEQSSINFTNKLLQQYKSFFKKII